MGHVEEGRVLKWVREGLNDRVPLNDFVSDMMFEGKNHSPRSIAMKRKEEKRMKSRITVVRHSNCCCLLALDMPRNRPIRQSSTARNAGLACCVHSPFSLSDPILIRSALRGLTSDGIGHVPCPARRTLLKSASSLSHRPRSGGFDNLRATLQLALLRSPVVGNRPSCIKPGSSIQYKLGIYSVLPRFISPLRHQ